MKRAILFVAFTLLLLAAWTLNHLQLMGSEIFRSKVEIKELIIKLEGLRSDISQRNITMALISDIHFDYNGTDYNNLTMTKQFLDEIVDQINALNVTYVIIAGDFINYQDTSKQLRHHLLRLKCEKLIGVLGNHDFYAGKPREIAATISSIPNSVLLHNNAFYPFGNTGKGSLAFVGVEDFLEGDFDVEKAFRHVPKDSSRIVITHNPDSFPHFRNYKADLILAGHSHGGQIQLPFIGTPLRYLSMLRNVIPAKLYWRIPWITFTRAMTNWDLIEGMHEQTNKFGSKNRMYVTKGLASHRRVRLFAPPEITLIRIH